jgi:hypothetical protein
MIGQVLLPVLKIEAAMMVLAFFLYARTDTRGGGGNGNGDGAAWPVWVAMFMMVPLAMHRLRKFWSRHSAHAMHDPVAFLYVCAYDILFNPETFFRVLHVTFSVLGLVFRRYFYAFHLFEIIVMSPTLTNVVRAVWVPSVQLGMTAILAMIVLYTFTLVSFYFFRDSFSSGKVGWVGVGWGGAGRGEMVKW